MRITIKYVVTVLFVQNLPYDIRSKDYATFREVNSVLLLCQPALCSAFLDTRETAMNERDGNYVEDFIFVSSKEYLQ